MASEAVVKPFDQFQQVVDSGAGIADSGGSKSGPGSLSQVAGGYVVDNLRAQVRTVTIRDAELQEQTRALKEEVEVLIDELTKEKKARKRIQSEVQQEREQVMRMRSTFIEKGNTEASIKKKIALLQQKFETTKSKLSDVEQLESTALLHTKNTEDRMRGLKREVDDMEFSIRKKTAALSQVQSANYKTLHNLKKVEGELKHSSYIKKMEVQGLEKTYSSRASDVKRLKEDFTTAEDKVKALSKVIKEGSEKFNTDKQQLLDKIDEAHGRLQMMTREIKTSDEVYGKMKDALAEGQSREKLLAAHLQDSAELRAELNLDLNEKQRQTAVLEQSLGGKNRETMNLIDRLTENKQEVALLREKLMNHDIALTQTKKELAEEEARVKVTSMRLQETKDFDQQQRGKLREVAEKSARLEAEIAQKESADQTLRNSLNERVTSVEILRSDVTEATKHREELKEMITKTLKEGEQLTEILAEKKATWDRSSEHFASRVAELKEAAESLAFTHEKLSNALLLKESENENLAMLETQTREDREKELSALKTRIDEMTGVTGELHKRLTANYETIREQRRHLDDIEPETVNLQSMMKEKSVYLSGLGQQFQQQEATLKAKIGAREAAIERATAESAALNTRIKALNPKAFALANENEVLRQKVMAQELMAHEARDKFIEAKKLEQESEARLTDLENQCKEVETKLGECTRNCTILSEHLLEAESERELTSRKLSDQAHSKLEVENEMKQSKEALHALERQLKLKEGSFKIDSITVAAKIRELQSQLVEKVESAERLTTQLQMVESNNDGVRAQLMALHENMEEKKYDGEKQLEEWRDKVSRMFEELGQRKVAEVTLQSSISRKKEETSEVTLHYKIMEDGRQVTQNELEMTQDKLLYLQNKLDRHNAKIAETNNTLDAREAVVQLLRKQSASKEQVERSLRKQYDASQHEMVVIKDRYDEIVVRHEDAISALEKLKLRFGEKLSSETQPTLAFLFQRLKGRQDQLGTVGRMSKNLAQVEEPVA